MRVELYYMIIFLLAATNLIAEELNIYAISKPNEAVKLIGPDANLQLVVTGENISDMTRSVSYETDPSSIVSVSKTGHVTALANGSVKVTAKTTEGLSAQIELTVEQFEIPQPINFPNEIVPLFTKHGCNGGGCHGKSEGQNGFKLSLLGFEPTEDFEYLVKEVRGRRVFPAAPQHSLLLRKGAGDLPHGGGARFEHDSWDYRAIVRWIEQGMPYAVLMIQN